MQYKVTHPDGYAYTVEAEACERTPAGEIVLLDARRTALATIAAGVEVIITDADGREVTPTVGS